MRRALFNGSTPRFLCAMALALCAVLSPAQATATPARSAGPFAATALWINHVSPEATAQTIAAQASSLGVHTLFVKAGDGATLDPQFSAALLAGLRSAGISVCAWTFAYGQDPLGEAAVAVAAAHAGAVCLVVDAEGQYDKLYGAAQLYLHTLRRELGRRFPIGLAGQAEVLQHPTFPYSVFLGPGGFDVDLPQIYWRELGLSVDAADAATLAVNSIYQRPIAPVGQLFGAVSPSEVLRFRSLAAAEGSVGVSFFDLDAPAPAALGALAGAAPHLARRAISAPTIKPGADGDEVLWAQELLNAAGAKLPVGGFFGASTAQAEARFQSRHRLHVNGVLTAETWRALMRYHPREPSWAKTPPLSAR